MILDGNSRVGEAKFYATPLEMKQAKEMEKLKTELKEAHEIIKILSRVDISREEYRRALNRIQRQKERKDNERENKIQM